MRLALRERRLLLLILVVAATAIGGAAFQRARRPHTTPLAPLTPSAPGVNEFRSAVGDASVVILVLDAVRADHVGVYGYPRPTTPNLDRLAAESVLFERHFSQTTETKSSTSSLLTSQFADTHLADGPRALIPGTFTMQAGLEAAGFRTVLVSSNLKACPLYGLGNDFQDSIWDRQLEEIARDEAERIDPALAARAFETWLAAHGGERFFAYLHLLPPHYPYRQPDEFTRLFAGLEPVKFAAGEPPFPERLPRPFPTPPPLPEWINLYDANLRYADWAAAEIERVLREAGLLDTTVLLITSDHGESFSEQGHVWHGYSVHDQECHVPLLIRFPGGVGAGRRLPALTRSVDILPTIFDLLAIPYPQQGVQGVSLLPLLAGQADSATDYAFTRAGGGPSKYLVRSREWAFILWGNGEWRALYDLTNDPGQRRNVISQHPEVADEMLAAFRRFAEAQRRPPLDFLDPNAVMPPLPDVPAIEMSPEDRARVNRIADIGYLR